MEAGPLRHRVTVERKTETQDASGDPVASWVYIGEMWAEVEPTGGREGVYQGTEIIAQYDTKITARYSPLSAAITANHRLTHQGTLFNVVAPAQTFLKQQRVVIRCTSGVNDG